MVNYSVSWFVWSQLGIWAPCPIVGYGQDKVSTLSTMQKSMVELGIIIKWVSAWLGHKIVVETTNGMYAPLHTGGQRHRSFPSESSRQPKLNKRC